VLDQRPQQKVGVLVVWQSILQTDWARPGAGILTRVRDARARQYWDPENIFPKRLRDRMRADLAHPQPSCCEADEGIPWDLVAVYPAGVSWDENLPAAVYIEGPVWKLRAELNGMLSKMDNPKPVQDQP
jgi:hypothetical protein